MLSGVVKVTDTNTKAGQYATTKFDADVHEVMLTVSDLSTIYESVNRGEIVLHNVKPSGDNLVVVFYSLVWK